MKDRDGWVHGGNFGNAVPRGHILAMCGLESFDAEGGVGIGYCYAAQ